jgi:hypothetical protein
MPAGLCRESPFTALASEATFAAPDDPTTRPTPNGKPTPTTPLQMKNYRLSLRCLNVLYRTEKVQGREPAENAKTLWQAI